MERIYEDAAYGPQTGCFWADTVTDQPWPLLDQDTDTDIAIVGGGFTGLNAALTAARAGARVIVLEAQTAGWGASGRNGGFCCLGGAKASRATLLKRHGPGGLEAWNAAERAAIAHVAGLIERHGWDVDSHSDGETVLAHTSGAWRAIQASAAQIAADHGVAATLIPQDRLHQAGLGGPWHGAMTIPLGFALNPRKYHAGLATAARDAGATLLARTPVTAITAQGSRWRLNTNTGTVTADRVVIATNGYSSEDVPGWLRSRTLPVQSSVIVTRPLSEDERGAAGWTSRQMCYDSRVLLHYFRLLPDNRFLFGMRGGLSATPEAEIAIRRRIRADFNRLFPAWRDVEIAHDWSGLVCLMARLVPFVGPVPGHAGLFAALGYHGNGVAMGSYSGALVADLAMGRTPPGPYPPAMRDPPKRFPLGRFRRALLWPVYALAGARDL
jgi:glycine/D-amino acid oxidase-like deaminating enzyme